MSFVVPDARRALALLSIERSSPESQATRAWERGVRAERRWRDERCPLVPRVPWLVRQARHDLLLLLFAKSFADRGHAVLAAFPAGHGLSGETTKGRAHLVAAWLAISKCHARGFAARRIGALQVSTALTRADARISSSRARWGRRCRAWQRRGACFGCRRCELGARWVVNAVLAGAEAAQRPEQRHDQRLVMNSGARHCKVRCAVSRTLATGSLLATSARVSRSCGRSWSQ